MLALKCILRYVQDTKSKGLKLLRHQKTSLTVYSDAVWAGCPTTRCSTSGYCVHLGDNLISWSEKRQPTVSRSSAEAEYNRGGKRSSRGMLDTQSAVRNGLSLTLSNTRLLRQHQRIISFIQPGATPMNQTHRNRHSFCQAEGPNGSGSGLTHSIRVIVCKHLYKRLADKFVQSISIQFRRDRSRRCNCGG